MKIFYTLCLTVFFSTLWGQNILFVDDNDNITDNSDTVLYAMQNSMYSSFDYYKVADSSANPSTALLQTYDLVIWYASTDGGGLGFWASGSGGDADLTNYLTDGGRLWVIGSDLLYGGSYSTPTSFTSGDFAYEYMGLTSYNVQAFGDDGGLGVSQVDYTSSTSIPFPATLDWIFATAYWVDGVTVRSGGLSLYEMGPSTYTLYQEVCMSHFKDIETNVLSTFFDPALISAYGLRKDFIESSITYLLNFDLGLNKNIEEQFSVSPNPSLDKISIELENNSVTTFSIASVNGVLVKNGDIVNGKATVSISDLKAGIYFLTVNGTTKQIVKL